MYNSLIMAKLIIKQGGKTLKEHPLGEATTIGRESGDIVLKNPAVSAVHARISRRGDVYEIQDMRSTNGTFVNMGRVSSHELKHGDIINIGKFSLEFINPAESSGENLFGTPDSAGMTLMISTEELMQRAEMERKESPAEKDGKSSYGSLALSGGSSGSRVVYRLRKETTLLGSGENADIHLKGLTIGSVAASINYAGGKCTLKYLGGFTKPKVNGEKISGERELKGRDKVEIGSYSFEFLP